MSETFEPFHVPQQSRRDKLRVISENHNHQPSLPSSTIQGCSGLTPLYGPTLLSSGMLTIAGGVAGVYQTTKNENRLKEDGVNFMDYSGSFVSPNPNPYVDPNPSVNINPNCCITDMDNSYMYNTQVAHNFRNFQSSFDSGVVMNGKGLSLSLSSSIPNPVELSMQNHYSGSSVYEQKGLNGYLVRGSSSINEASRSSVPLGPFTGYAAILKGSRFLKPAQQILEEFCDVGRGVYAEKSSSELSLVDPCINGFTEGNIVDGSVSSSDVGDHKRKKTRLFSMLDEVYKRYKQYYQQMQAVVQSFETVAGLSNAAPFTCLALKAMSKHFWNLKKAITDQLRSTSNALGEENTIKSESSCFGLSDGQISHPRGSYNSSVLDQQHVWRPQRGLPERAVAVLRAWLFEHFLHPYPTDTDKQMLANQTGLSRSQVSNWFINARVRLWKPMVDEIHALELKQAQKSSETEEPNSHRQSENRQNVQSDQHSHSANTISNHSLSSKRHRDDINQPSNTGNELINFAYNGTSGVSLTLGLHQNNGICMSEPISINRFQSFGVEGNSNAYVGGFEPRRNNFGSDMEGQLLHDFVG